MGKHLTKKQRSELKKAERRREKRRGNKSYGGDRSSCLDLRCVCVGYGDGAVGILRSHLAIPSLRSHEPAHTGYKANKEGQPGQSEFAKSKPDEAPRAWRHSASAGRGGGEANRCEWEPSHDVGSGRLHGGECGCDSRFDTCTE